VNYIVEFLWFVCVLGCCLAFIVMFAGWLMQGLIKKGEDEEEE
jgi:hypothetical protein